jgi:hypothetical protein
VPLLVAEALDVKRLHGYGGLWAVGWLPLGCSSEDGGEA